MSAEWINLTIFLMQAVVYFSFMVVLLHFRDRLGLGVFLAVLGVMHFLETYLAAVFYVQLPYGVVSPGSSIYFAGKLMLILLLYMKEDAAAVRQPIYGLLLGNLLTVGMAQILQLHGAVMMAGGRPFDFAFLSDMGWLMIWGTAMLYIDAIGIILLYERFGRVFGGNLVLRYGASAAVVLIFDQIGFYIVLRSLLDAPIEVFWGGLKAKLVSVAIYTVLFAVYRRLSRDSVAQRSDRPVGDVFNDLTYRERYEDLLARSGRDMLTGLYDRSRLEAEGPKLIHASAERREPVSVLMIDADHFKDINDRFGHLQGDDVLRQIANVLSGKLGARDHLSRYGGEEFAMVLPGSDHDMALAFAEHLRTTVCEQILRPDGQPVTLCLGVATAPADGNELSVLMGLADARLYQAKNGGRNCIYGRHGRWSGSQGA